MTLRLLRIPAVSVLGATLFVASAFAQTRPAEPASPYGGVTVEDIIARVNDQIITRSDYDRAMKELDEEGRQRGMTMQQLSAQHRDLLRNLIDQQLWLSKGKELGVNGETELVNRLNEIRKQYNMSSMEDLEKAAQEQGVSFEDFKANIRNQIVTQEVMRDEVGRHINITPGEVQRYYEEHKAEYSQPETVRLSEILVSTGAGDPDDAKIAAAKAKADDIEAKLKGGADFAQTARTSSDGQTASEGGDLGQFKRGALAKVLEDATFDLKAGQFTEPIRTRQGYVILEVAQHSSTGVQAYKDVEQQVEESYYMAKMEPAMREYLTKMREDAYINLKPGYEDTGASANKRINPIAYSAYVPPSPKKKKKAERTRFRENAHFRQKASQPQVVEAADTTTKPAATTASAKKAVQTSEKPGKKEKIRFGKAPTKTLPSAATAAPEDAGANSGPTGNTAAAAGSDIAQTNDTAGSLDQQAPAQKKTRFSARTRVQKTKAAKDSQDQKGSDVNTEAPAAPDAAEVSDKQTWNAPLGLGGDTANAKKKQGTATGEKTRFSDRAKTQQQQQQEPSAPVQPTAIPQAQGAPAPAQAPAPTPQQ